MLMYMYMYYVLLYIYGVYIFYILLYVYVYVYGSGIYILYIIWYIYIWIWIWSRVTIIEDSVDVSIYFLNYKFEPIKIKITGFITITVQVVLHTVQLPVLLLLPC
jgi:hypothetical protein